MKNQNYHSMSSQGDGALTRGENDPENPNPTPQNPTVVVKPTPAPEKNPKKNTENN